MTGASKPLVSTPGYQKMRDLCDLALSQPNGLCFPFTLANYDDLDACKKAARAFQQLFSSFRARARTTVQVRERSMVNAFGEQHQSPYDKLACMKTSRYDGVEINILPAVAFDIVHEILDPVTREPIEMVNAEGLRLERYISVIFDQINREMKDGTRSPTPLTLEQELDAFAIDERTFGEIYEKYRWRLKSTGLPYGVNPANAPIVDLVDTPMDDFGVGPEGEGVNES